MRLLYIKIPVHISHCLLRSFVKGAAVQPPTSRLNSVGNRICRHHRSISQNPCHFSYFRQCGEWGVTCSRNQRKSDCLCHALEVKGLMPNSHLPSHLRTCILSLNLMVTPLPSSPCLPYQCGNDGQMAIGK